VDAFEPEPVERLVQPLRGPFGLVDRLAAPRRGTPPAGRKRIPTCGPVSAAPEAAPSHLPATEGVHPIETEQEEEPESVGFRRRGRRGDEPPGG
jgi:hypothetical protein